MGGPFSFFSRRKAKETPKTTGKSRNVPKDNNDPVKFTQQVNEWTDREREDLQNTVITGAGSGGTISGDTAQAAVDQVVTVGAFKFNTHTEGGKVTVPDGTINILGAETAWQAGKMEFDRYKGKLVGAGSAKIAHEKFRFGDDANISTNGTQAHLAVRAPGISYAENGIEISTGIVTAENLDEIAPVSIGVKSPVLSGIGDEPFNNGSLNFTNGGVTGSVTKDATGLVAVPDFIKAASKDLELSSGEGGLTYKVNLHEATAGVDIGGFFSFYRYGDISGTVADDKSIIYHIDGNGLKMSLFGKDAGAFSVGAGMDIKCTDSGWTPINFSAVLETKTFGDFTANNLRLTADLKTSTFGLAADTIVSNTLPIEFSNVTFLASPEGFTAANADLTVHTDANNPDAAMKGKVTNLKISPDQGLSLESANVTCPAMTFNGIELNEASLNGSLIGNELNFRGEADGSIDVNSEYLKLSSQGLKVALAFNAIMGNKTPAPQQPAEGKKGVLADKKQLGSITASMTGTITAEVLAGSKSIASGEITDFSYIDKKFTLGNLKAAANLSLLDKTFEAGGELTADNLTYDAVEKMKFDKMTVALKNASYKEKALSAGVTVEINSGAMDQPVEAKAGDTADVPLDNNTEGTLTNIKLALTLGSKPSVGIGADNVELRLKLFKLNAQDFMVNVSSDNLSGTFGAVTATCDALNEKLSEYCGIDNVSLTVGKLAYSKTGISVEEISGEIGTNVNIFGGVSVNSVLVGYNFEKNSVNLGFGFNYAGDKFLKGASGKLYFNVGDTVSFEKAGDLNFDLGMWGAGKVGGATKTTNGFTFTDLSLTTGGTENEDTEPLSENMDSMLVKVLSFVPNVGITIAKLDYNNSTGFVRPAPDDVTITSFQKSFTLSEGIEGNFAYNKPELTVGLKANKAYPEDRANDPEATKEVFSEEVPVITIIPALLSANIGVHAGAGFTAGAELNAKTSKDDGNIRRFSGSAAANGDGSLYAGVFAGLTLNVLAAKAKAKLSGNIKATGAINLDGKIGFLYDSSQPFLQAFSLDRDAAATSAHYDMGAALAFQLNFTAGGEASLPAAIVPDGSKLKLYHTWNLLNVNLGEAKISGDVKYTEGVWEKTGEAVFKHINQFDVDKAMEELNQFGVTYDSLKADMDTINEICKKVMSGGGSILGLGDIMQDKTVKGLYSLYEKLGEIRKNGIENAASCYELMSKARKKLLSSAESEEKNLKEVETLNEIERQSQAAQAIITGSAPANAQTAAESGTETNTQTEGENTANASPYQDGMTQADYESVIEHFKAIVANGGDELDALAKLDPAAVMNTLKVYKLDYKRMGNESWENFRPDYKANADKQLSAVGKSVALNPDAQNYNISFNYDGKVFSDALEKLNDLQKQYYVKIDEVQKQIDETTARLKSGKFKKGGREEEEKKLDELTTYLQELLDKNVTSKRLSTSIMGFNSYLASEKSDVGKYTEAKSTKYLAGEIVSQSNAEISEELLNARREWVKSILSHIVEYYEQSKPKLSASAFGADSRLNQQFRVRQRALANGTWFESGMKGKYGAESFAKKKAQADAYLNLKQTYNGANDRLTSFFTVIQSAMETTEALQKASYSELKAAGDIQEKSNAIKSAVEQTEKAESIDITADTKRIKELVDATA